MFAKCKLPVERISNSKNSIESNALTRPNVLKSISLKMADDCPKVEENPVIFFSKKNEIGGFFCHVVYRNSIVLRYTV